MRGTQFLAAASANPDHPCHYMLAHQPTPCSIKTTPQALYTGLLNTIPKHSSSHIHTHFTNIDIQKLGPNTILGTPQPEINHSEHVLPRADQVHLRRLRCSHHTALATYRKRIDDSINEDCPHCSTNTHSLTHINPTLMHIRAHHNISSPLNLWHSSAVCFSSGVRACSDRQVKDRQQQQPPCLCDHSGYKCTMKYVELRGYWTVQGSVQSIGPISDTIVRSWLWSTLHCQIASILG